MRAWDCFMQRISFALALFLTSILFADQGFFSPKNYRVPSAVEQAGNSVVQVSVTRWDGHAWRSQGMGSAFVVENSQTLWTAAHVVELQSQSLGSGSSLNLELFDSFGQKIFDTANAGDSATLELIGDRQTPSTLPGDGYFESDFAKIQLSRPLGLRPIVVNSQKPNPAQNVYSIGFPGIGGIVDATKNTLRDGIQRSRSTMGQVMDPLQIVSNESERSPTSSNSSASGVMTQMSERLTERLTYLDMDGYFGQSGSPIFNEEGEAIGILVGRASRQEEGQDKTRIIAPHFSAILSPPPAPSLLPTSAN